MSSGFAHMRQGAEMENTKRLLGFDVGCEAPTGTPDWSCELEDDFDQFLSTDCKRSALYNDCEITLNAFRQSFNILCIWHFASQNGIHSVWKPHWTFYGSIANGLAAQDFNEGSAKLDVERGVDDGIESAVDVAKPSEGAVDLRRNVTSSAMSVEDVGHKERQPANKKNTCKTQSHTHKQTNMK